MTQFRLPFREARPAAGTPRPLRIAGRVQLVRFIRVRRARRYVLRVRPDGTLLVSIPPFGNIEGATAFVRTQAAWIAEEHARALRVLAQAPTEEEARALRARASEELPARLQSLAADHGFTVSRVRVRSQRTLWGSCSRNGTVSLNWRLIQMPDQVRDYILLHELAHLLHPDHSRRFWTLVAAMCPWYRDAHRWLRANT